MRNYSERPVIVEEGFLPLDPRLFMGDPSSFTRTNTTKVVSRLLHNSGAVQNDATSPQWSCVNR